MDIIFVVPGIIFGTGEVVARVIEGSGDMTAQAIRVAAEVPAQAMEQTSNMGADTMKASVGLGANILGLLALPQDILTEPANSAANMVKDTGRVIAQPIQDVAEVPAGLTEGGSRFTANKMREVMHDTTEMLRALGDAPVHTMTVTTDTIASYVERLATNTAGSFVHTIFDLGAKRTKMALGQAIHTVIIISGTLSNHAKSPFMVRLSLG
ncbi:hypothetical protein ABHI18_005714 [Aspergillus niger]